MSKSPLDQDLFAIGLKNAKPPLVQNMFPPLWRMQMN